MTDKTENLLAKVNISLPGEMVKPDAEFDCPAELVDGYLERGSAVRPTEPTSEITPNDAKDLDTDNSSDGDDSDSGTDAANSLEVVELTDEQKADAVRELLTSWLADDPEQKVQTRWNKDNSPRNKTLDNELKFDVKKDFVDPIWADVLVAHKAANSAED